MILMINEQSIDKSKFNVVKHQYLYAFVEDDGEVTSILTTEQDAELEKKSDLSYNMVVGEYEKYSVVEIFINNTGVTAYVIENANQALLEMARVTFGYDVSVSNDVSTVREIAQMTAKKSWTPVN